MKNIEHTYKHIEVEEKIDIYFTRPIGYLFAKMARSLRISPNELTIASMILGVASGHLFYYTQMSINTVGIFTKLVSNFLDSADGQLARMTNSRSDMGRMLDGISGHVIYLSIYLHIYLRYIHSGGEEWFLFMVLAAGLSHIIHCAWEDCYRNGYLYFTQCPDSNEVRSSISLKQRYRQTPWREGLLTKYLIYFEWTYTRFLELISPKFQIFKNISYKKFQKNIPTWLANEYRTYNRPMMKYYNILTINIRQYTLFLFLLLRHPEFFIVFELVALNIVFIYALLRQEMINKHLIECINNGKRSFSIYEEYEY